MERTVTIKLEKSDCEALDRLSAWTGFTPDAAALYAVRLIDACIREGLLDGEMAYAWPQEAQRTSEDGRVIAFPGIDAQKGRKDEATV